MDVTISDTTHLHANYMVVKYVHTIQYKPTNTSVIVLLKLIAPSAVTGVGAWCVETDMATGVGCWGTLVDVWRDSVGGGSGRGQVRGGMGQVWCGRTKEEVRE